MASYNYIVHLTVLLMVICVNIEAFKHCNGTRAVGDKLLCFGPIYKNKIPGRIAAVLTTCKVENEEERITYWEIQDFSNGQSYVDVLSGGLNQTNITFFIQSQISSEIFIDLTVLARQSSNYTLQPRMHNKLSNLYEILRRN